MSEIDEENDEIERYSKPEFEGKKWPEWYDELEMFKIYVKSEKKTQKKVSVHQRAVSSSTKRILGRKKRHYRMSKSQYTTNPRINHLFDRLKEKRNKKKSSQKKVRSNHRHLPKGQWIYFRRILLPPKEGLENKFFDSFICEQKKNDGMSEN